MDPDLESFLRRPPKQLQIQHTATVDDTITCAAMADKHALIAVGQADTAAIVIFNAIDLSVLRELAGHVGGTNSLAFAGSSRLVSAGEDGAAAVWDPNTGHLRARLDCEGEKTDKVCGAFRSSKGHTVTHVACNAAGTLAACAAGRTLHVFEVTADDIEAKRRVFPAVSGGVIEDVKFVGDSRVLCAYYGGVVLHSTEPGGMGVLLEYPTNIMSAAAMPDMSYVVGGCMDNCVHIWRFESSPEAAAAARIAAEASREGSSTEGSQDGSTEGSQDGSTEGSQDGSTEGSQDGSTEGSQDGSTEGSSTGGEEQPEGTALVEYSCGGYQSKVTGTLFNGSNTMLATTGGTQCTVWDFTGPDGPAGTLPVVGLGHTKTVTCQAWQPIMGSPILATGGRDGRVLVYDVSEYADPPEEDMPIPKFAAPAAVAPNPDLKDEVTALTWSATNPRLLYAAHASGILRCWELQLESDEKLIEDAAQQPAGQDGA